MTQALIATSPIMTTQWTTFLGKITDEASPQVRVRGGIAGGGAEDEYGRSVKDEVEEISAHRQAQQPEDRRGSQLVNRKPVGMEKQMSAVVGRAMEEARSSSVRVEPGQRGREPGTSTTMRSSGVSTRAPPPATRSSEEIFREAIEHRIRHKNIPIPLSEKRRLMRKMGTQFSVVSHGTDETPALFRFSLKTFHIPP